MDIEARVVEVWHPGDERPKIVTGVLRWRAPGGPDLELDLAAVFGSPL